MNFTPRSFRKARVRLRAANSAGLRKLPPELEKHIKNLSSGEVSDPILYNGDYYIFKVEKKFDPDKDRMPLPSNEEVKNMLQNQKNERYAEERMQELRQRAVIELKE